MPQDVTLSTLKMELWGGDCSTTIADKVYPGFYLGQVDVFLTPLQVMSGPIPCMLQWTSTSSPLLSIHREHMHTHLVCAAPKADTRGCSWR